ncbi:MAG: putative nitroreductase like [Streblomastix strix]|uniref:Putative nitroreductase like n=1 Tax=Streblomastix strix TaxID=222440 RepID=A0A5J4VUT3_9EUKA|nr:MAG: putative nitroreductase like [Streblomastix strix]
MNYFFAIFGGIISITVLFLVIYTILLIVNASYSKKDAIFRDRPATDDSFSQFDAHKLCISRKSVRRYTQKDIEPHTLDKIKAYISDETKMTGPFGSRIRVVLVSTDEAPGGKLSTRGKIKGAKYYLVGFEKPETRLIDFGYTFERLVLFCTQLGISTCWIGGTFNRSEFESVCELQEGEKIYIVCPIGYCDESEPKSKGNATEPDPNSHRPLYNIAFKGLYQKLRYSDQVIKENSKSDKIGNGISNQESIGQLSLLNALEAVQWSPSAVNCQPWRLFILENATNPNKHIIHFFVKKFGAFYPLNDCGIAMSNFTYVYGDKKGIFEIRKEQEIIQKQNMKDFQMKDDGLFPVLNEADEGLTYAATWVEL